MKYLVTMEMIQQMAPSDPRQLIQLIEERVIKQHEIQVKQEAEKKILAGGSVVGKMCDVFIVEAASNEELSGLLRSLPLWSIHKVDVIPLESFEDVLAKERQEVEQMKAALK
ncbi:MAG: muconolactone Delta-isomerase family protein [Methanophagales archaeon]|nr:muconolactone Delta-isomerase family protein [Methanophagales archaeon]